MFGLQYKGFRAQVEYDEQDAIWVGEVLDVADSLSFHARTWKGARRMFRQSIDNYLHFCKRTGKTPEVTRI